VPPSPRVVPPTTLTPGGTSRDEVPELTVKVRRPPWLIIGIGVAAVAAAAVVAVALRKPPVPPPTIVRPAPTKPAPTKPKAPLLVRLRLETVPAGARVVRVSDGVVMGITPQTFELRASTEKLRLRLEKEGYVAATKEVSLAANNNVSLMLEAEKPAPTHKPAGKRHGGFRPPPTPEPEPAEPAKL
jgi:hypothetical protein